MGRGEAYLGRAEDRSLYPRASLVCPESAAPPTLPGALSFLMRITEPISITQFPCEDKHC